MGERMKLVYIEWEDAHSSNGWHTKEEFEQFINEAPVIIQIGWVFEETKRYIAIAARHAPNGIFTNDDDEAYGQIQRIPKTWIRKRVDLTKYI